MAACVSDMVYDREWIVGLIDTRAPMLKKRGSYKKRQKEISN